MSRTNCGSDYRSSTGDRPKKQQKGRRNKKSITRIKRAAIPRSAVLSLVAVISVCVTVCYLATGLAEGQVTAKLIVRAADWFEIQTEIAKTVK